MKKVIFASIAVAGLIFSGCSSKAPEVDMSSKTEAMHDHSHHYHHHDHMSDADMLKKLLNSTQANIQTVYFDFDKFNIKADQQGVISANAALLNAHGAGSFSVKVEGNCDEWGSDEYNYALGLKRAKSVKDALIRSGVSEDRIAVVSYGESNPVCSSKSKDCDAQNRRAEFKILP